MNEDTQLTEKIIPNEKFKERESNYTYQESQKSVKSVFDDIDFQENNVSVKGYANEEIDNVDNNTPAVQFQYIENNEILPMDIVHIPTRKVSKEDIEPKKYDIVTTVKNKLNIENKRV